MNSSLGTLHLSEKNSQRLEMHSIAGSSDMVKRKIATTEIKTLLLLIYKLDNFLTN